MQNEEVTNKQWGSDSLKNGLFLGETSNSPSPPQNFLICRHLISRLTFRGKTTFKLIVKLLLKTNSKQITSYRHLPPNPFLAVCKCTALLRQISDQNQTCSLQDISCLYTKLHSTQKCGTAVRPVAAKPSCDKETFSRTCGRKKPSRICQYTTKNHS